MLRSHKKIFSVLLAIIMLLPAVPPMQVHAEPAGGTKIIQLKTDDLTEPVGLISEKPAFSWKMESGLTGQRQTAYQIIVAKDERLSDPVWDSGRQDASASVGIPYAGKALQGSTVYYWKVNVWNKEGQPVSSQTTKFETGLMGGHAWDASQWIQVGDSNEDAVDSYTLELDMQIVHYGTAVVFAAKDTANLLMWQLLINDQGKLILKPHYRKNGAYSAIKTVDITRFAKGALTDVQHVKLEVTPDAVTTYLNGYSDPADVVQASQLGEAAFKGEIGEIGIRAHNDHKEDGWIDNMKLVDSSGTVVKDYNFDDGVNPFTAGSVIDGKLSTKYSDTTPELIGIESSAFGGVPVHYTVEADLTCTKEAVTIAFNAADTANYYMWQFNTTTGNKVQIIPHIWKNGNYTRYADQITDITSLVGGVEAFQTEEAHVKLDVTNTEIKTYVNGTLVHTFPMSRSTGIPAQIGYIGVRASDEESGTVDNLKLTDYTDSAEGDVLYNYTFDDGNPFFGGSVKDGKFISAGGFGVLLPAQAQGSSTFRKEIMPRGELASAKLYVTGLGVFDVFINGERVGTRQADGSVVYDELKPGYTMPGERVFSYAYDVTHMITANQANAISATVSSGWWTGRVAGRSGKNNAFRAQLLLSYTDGSNEIVGTDRSWKTAIKGPILSADIYDGEIYDANADLSYRMPEYNDSQWAGADLNTEFSGEIVPQIGPSVRVRKDLTLTPKETKVYDGASGTAADRYGRIHVTGTYSGGSSFPLKANEKAVVDLGQNFAGWEEIKVEGPKGTTLTMRHGEMLNDSDGLFSRGNDGPEGSIYTANLRSAKAAGRYILNGNGVEIYSPSHTYYGFRYLEISTTADVTIRGVRGIVVTSVAENIGTLTTSNGDVNRLISNTVWGQYSNYLSVPTDCPQRDERQGWTADTQVFSTAGSYNADAKGFLRKFMQDMRDAQAANGAYPDTAPSGAFGGGGQLGWADAGVIVPYNLYKMYGDKSVIEENYASMQKFMDVFMASTDKRGGGHSYGDWLAYESNDDGMKSLLGIAYFAWDAQMMAEMAGILGRNEDAVKYRQIYEEEKAYFQQQYVNVDGSLKRGEQTACLMALKMDLLPDEKSKKVVKQTLLDNIKRNGNKLQTGFLGTSIIMQTLSDIGAADVAYQLLLQRNNPSWLYSVDQGATTIWERWNSYTKEGGFGPVGMNSFNHYAYGAVMEWMYGYMAGVMYDLDQPGFQHVILQPTPDQIIRSVNCSYDSAYGSIISNWKYVGGAFQYEATIPANTTATIYIPVEEGESVTVNGKAASEVTTEQDGLSYVETKDGKARFEAVAGSYQFKTGVTEYVYVALESSDASIPCLVRINDGELQKIGGSLKLAKGETVKIQAVPQNNIDYVCSGWTGGATSQEDTITVAPTDSITLTAKVEWNGYDNLAQGKTAATNSNYNAPPAWSLANLNDGKLNHLAGNNGYCSGTFSSPDCSSNPVILTVDLGETTQFDRIHLYPRTDTFGPEGKTLNFPVDYTIQVSNDGGSFTTIKEVTNQAAPAWKPAVLMFDSLVSARYVRIEVTKLGLRDEAGNDANRFQLSEFGVYNTTLQVPPAITTADLPAGTAGKAYSQTLAAEGTAPITWSVESGKLPDGLTLAEDGTLSGTPTADGTFNFTVKAANAAGSATKELSIQVAAAPKTGLDHLNDLIASSEKLDENKFEAESWANLQAKLAAAKEVAGNPEATPEAINEAFDQLSRARNDLVYRVDKDILRLSIEIAQNTDTTGCTEISITALNDALEAAQNALNQADATQEEVNDAAKDLLNAIINLKDIMADKAELQKLADLAAGLTEAKYTPASWSTVKGALEAAQTKLTDDNATQEAVDGAYGTLAQAVAHLTLRAQTNSLNVAIELAQTIVSGLDQYAPATVEGLQEKLDAAKAVQGNLNATQEEVDAAAKALAEAAAKARLKANKKDLQQAYAQAQKLDPEKYTEGSFQQLNRVLAATETVLKDENAMQAEVDKAKDALTDAVQTLEVKPTSGTGNSSSPDSNSSSSSSSSGNGSSSSEDTAGTVSTVPTGTKTDSPQTGEPFPTAVPIVSAAALAGMVLILALKKKTVHQ